MNSFKNFKSLATILVMLLSALIGYNIMEGIDAATVSVPGWGSSAFYKYDRGDGTYWADSAEGIWVNGKYVWCLEPTIEVHDGSTATEVGDVMAGGLWLRKATDQSGNSFSDIEVTKEQKIALLTPIVLNEMDLQDVQDIFGDDAKAFAEHTRGMGAQEWYTAIQLSVWASVGQITFPSQVYSHNGVNTGVIDKINAEINNGFWDKWQNIANKLKEVLDKGYVEDPNNPDAKIYVSYDNNSAVWVNDKVGQMLYEGVSGKLIVKREKPTEKDDEPEPEKIKIFKELEGKLEKRARLKQYTLKGAEFTLFKDGRKFATAKTDESGVAEFSVPAKIESNIGDYEIQETKPPLPDNGIAILTKNKRRFPVGAIKKVGTGRNAKIISTFSSRGLTLKVKEDHDPGTTDVTFNKSGTIEDRSFGATLAGAEFTFAIYDGIETDKVLGSITYKTNASGQIRLMDSSAIVSYNSGEELMRDFVQNGFPSVKIKYSETTPPPGFLNGDASWKELSLSDTGGDDPETTPHRLTGSGSASNQPNQFTVTKRQRNNSLYGGGLVDGAQFTLSGTGGSETLTSQNGTVTFKNITPGEYTLSETTPATGYYTNENTAKISVSKSGEVGVMSTTSAFDVVNVPLLATSSESITVENTPFTANMYLTKINEKDRPLHGAKFKLVQVAPAIDKSDISGHSSIGHIRRSETEENRTKYSYIYKKDDHDKFQLSSVSKYTKYGVSHKELGEGAYRIYDERTSDFDHSEPVASFEIDKKGTVSKVVVSSQDQRFSNIITTKYESDNKPAKVSVTLSPKSKFTIDESSAETDSSGMIDFTPRLQNEKGENGFIIGAQYMLEETEAPQGYPLPRIRKRVYMTVHTNPNDNKYELHYRVDTNDRTSENNEEWVTGTEKVVPLGSKGVIHTPEQSSELIKAPEEIDTISLELDEMTKKLTVHYEAMNMTRDKLPATGGYMSIVIIAAISMIAYAGYDLTRRKQA